MNLLLFYYWYQIPTYFTEHFGEVNQWHIYPIIFSQIINLDQICPQIGHRDAIPSFKYNLYFIGRKTRCLGIIFSTGAFFLNPPVVKLASYKMNVFQISLKTTLSFASVSYITYVIYNMLCVVWVFFVGLVLCVVVEGGNNIGYIIVSFHNSNS